MPSVKEIKTKYDEFVRRGGKPEMIAKKSIDTVARDIYKLVNSSELFGDGGIRLSLEEKMKVVGIPFVAQKLPFEKRVEVIRTLLSEFVEAGGKVEDLKKTDYIYQQIHGIKLYNDEGKRLSMEEKFEYLGHPRKAKMSQDVRADAIAAISKFIEEGGDIYMTRKYLPFFRAEYGSYAQTQRPRVSGDLAFQTNLRELGFDYSEMYYKFRKIEEILRFRNEDGFVDSYRKDTKMDNFIKISAYKLGLPIPVFVGLVGNADLEGCYLDTEYFGFVREALQKYLKIHTDFVGLSKKDKPLYEKMRHIGRMAFVPEGSELTTDDIACLLGFDGVKSDFGDGYETSNVSEILHNARNIAMQKGGKLTRADLPESDYRRLINMIASTGATTSAFFKLYDIDYEGKEGQRLSRVWVDKYPYMKEMRAERDRILKENGVSMNGDCKKEDLFDVLIVASLQAFEKFKPQIFNFEAEFFTKSEKDARRKAKEEAFLPKSVKGNPQGNGKV